MNHAEYNDAGAKSSKFIELPRKLPPVKPSPTEHRNKGEQEPQTKFAPCEYVIESKLGAGVFGEVFLATSEKNGEEVALKRISKRNPKFDPQMVSREITAGEALKNPGIVAFKSNFETLNNIYLVYELVDGQDLCTFMTERNFEPVGEKDAKRIIRQIVSAMLYCHEQGIAHRDIKLDNILISKDGKTKMIDFGLSSSKLQQGDKCKDYVGSPEYAAPEILARKPYDPFRADIFSIGVVLYGLLFGEFPFSTADRWDKVALGEHPAIRWADKVPSFPYVISSEAKELIERMLEVDPQKRITLLQILNHKWVNEEPSAAKLRRTGSSLVETVADTFDGCRFFEDETVRNNTTIKIY